MHQTITWLLNPLEPGVRAQALIDFGGRAHDDPEVIAAQEESLVHGSIAKVLNGLILTSDHDSYEKLMDPRYGTPYHRLTALVDMGAPRGDARVHATLERILEVFAKPDGGFGRTGGHVCVTGNVVRAANHFGRADDPRVKKGLQWLLANQRTDGGSNCFPEDNPKSTVDSWEPLAALGTVSVSERSPEIRRAIERGVEFFLEQRLGVEAGYEPWRRIHFPRHYYYDFLLGLELVTRLGNSRDSRLKPALDLLASKSVADDRWALDITHPDVDPEGDPPYKPIMGKILATVIRLEVEPPGNPSRWATLAAMRVLREISADHTSIPGR
jgi:hypothetical protein